MQEEIVSKLPETWDYVDKNIVYSHPVPSDSIPSGIILADEDNCVGEKDVFLYDSETRTIGYLEIKSKNSHNSKRKAREQLKTAQDHWNCLGYKFTGGYVFGDLINIWSDEEINFNGIKPGDFTPKTVPKSEANQESIENTSKGRVALKLEELGWDEAFEDVLYGDVLSTDLDIKDQGLIQSNQYNTHFGQMDAVAHRDYGEGQIIGHIERLDNYRKLRDSIEASADRMDFSYEFWTSRGYDFQGALYHQGTLYPRDLENQKWIDRPPE